MTWGTFERRMNWPTDWIVIVEMHTKSINWQSSCLPGKWLEEPRALHRASRWGRYTCSGLRSCRQHCVWQRQSLTWITSDSTCRPRRQVLLASVFFIQLDNSIGKSTHSKTFPTFYFFSSFWNLIFKLLSILTNAPFFNSAMCQPTEAE